ncbi:pterin-4-alpha-carbinolamine dehydratase [Blastocladiella britannica]|nr:pterin-4-alpha-carbinolamine dehydratase [Blastocladiella britannica]
MIITKLANRTSALAPLVKRGWADQLPKRDAIHKTYMFKDFVNAWQFMSAVALRAEASDHHPEWSNVYNKVEVTWSTHDADGCSERDVKLAEFCDTVAGKLAANGKENI